MPSDHLRKQRWTTLRQVHPRTRARLLGKSQRSKRNSFARLLTTIVAMSGSKVDDRCATDQARCGLLHNLELQGPGTL